MHLLASVAGKYEHSDGNKVSETGQGVGSDTFEIKNASPLPSTERVDGALAFFQPCSDANLFITVKRDHYRQQVMTNVRFEGNQRTLHVRDKLEVLGTEPVLDRSELTHPNLALARNACFTAAESG